MRPHSARQQHNRRLAAAIGFRENIDYALMGVVNLVIAGNFVAHGGNLSRASFKPPRKFGREGLATFLSKQPVQVKPV
jgi:hypothetical protein